VPGVSDNIRVRSIVGRFLEHSRVYWFANGGEAEIYCSSADWMERNLLRRIETCFPISIQTLRSASTTKGWRTISPTNTQAWALHADGHYERLTSGRRHAHSAQAALLAKICLRATAPLPCNSAPGLLLSRCACG